MQDKGKMVADFLRSRIVVCAGMFRSGSTWQFNAVRLLLRNAQPTASVWTGWGRCSLGAKFDWQVYKTHDLNEVNGVRPVAVLSSYRDVRAVVGSMIRMGWLDNDKEQAISFVEAYRRKLDDLIHAGATIVSYADIIDSPVSALRNIARSIDLDPSNADLEVVARQVEEMRSPGKFPSGNFLTADTETLLHSGHRGGGCNREAVSYLRPEVLSAIEAHPDAILISSEDTYATPRRQTPSTPPFSRWSSGSPACLSARLCLPGVSAL